MAKIKPFKAIRPTRDKVSLVASRSYLSYDKETLIEKLEHNPTLSYTLSILIILKNKKVFGKKKYSVVKRKLKDFLQQGILKR